MQKDAFRKAELEGLLTIADVTFATRDGLSESELEDLLNAGLYSNMLQTKYGVSTLTPKFKGNRKWSDRLRDAFKNQVKPWSDSIKAKVKQDIAELVEGSASTALNEHHRGPIDALILSLEQKLSVLAASKH